jgi:hypothetical protein
MRFQDSSCLDIYGFTQRVDPPPIYPHQQYITYLQGRIFDLEYDPGSGNRDKSEDDSINNVDEPLCNNPYCLCPYHKKHGPPSPPPPTPSMWVTMGKAQLSLICGTIIRHARFSLQHAIV